MANLSPFDLVHLDEEIKLYEPSSKVAQKMGTVVLYALVAPYNSGKDSVMNWLISHRPDKFAAVVGDTTRQRREGEVDGATYHFRSHQEMIEDLHNQRFVQVVPGFAGNFYATRPEQYPTDKIGVKPIQAREMRNYKKLKLKQLKWFQIVPSSFEAWLGWQSNRTMSSKDLADRNAEAIESYVLSLMNRETLFVLNDSIEDAAGRIVRVADGRTLPDAVRAKQIAARNLEKMKKYAKQQ